MIVPFACYPFGWLSIYLHASGKGPAMDAYFKSLSKSGISGVIFLIIALLSTPVIAGGEPTAKPEPSANLAPKVETVVTPASTALAIPPKAKSGAGTGITLGVSSAPPNFEEANGITPLHLAAATGDVAHITYLIAQSMPLDLTTHDGATALHWAAQFGHSKAVRVLILGGAPLEAKTDQGYTALHWAAAIGHLDIITILVESGADLEAITVKGQTPLHIATALDQILLVTALLNAGANLEASLDAQYPRWRQGG